MDAFARALIVADQILRTSPYLKLRAKRYASFDTGDGAKFEKGKLTLKDLHAIASKAGEPRQISGQQELYEQILARFT